jgi:hypothetical protein
MQQGTPRTLSISRDLKISREFLKLRTEFCREISDRLDTTDPKVGYYFERAFTRWMFAVVKHGLNPFVDLVSARDFVQSGDLTYFERKYLGSQNFGSFDWSWLDIRLRNIHNTEPTPLGTMTTFIRDGEASLSYVWPEGEAVTYTIPIKTYERARELYVGPSGTRDEYILLVVARYDACGTTKNHCAVPQDIVKFCNATTELFGSPINTCTRQYCSPFSDVEAYFGSLGSFFSPTFRLSTGVYMCNPPYDENIITETCTRLLQGLNSREEITVVLILPVWDQASQKKVKPYYESVKEFEGPMVLTQSGFIRSQTILNYRTHQFYDYYLDKYCKITDTYLIVLSNTNCTLQAVDIAQYWATTVNN